MSRQEDQPTPKGICRKSFDIPDCPICLEEQISDLVCAPCGHVFHAICLYQSLENNSACPCCRTRMTRISVYSMRFTLKCNSEAEEQIQAFYNSLADEEKQNVVEIMNKYEIVTKEYTKAKKQRDDLAANSKEQADKLVILEKSEREAQEKLKKATLSKEQLSQRVHLEELKRKELQSLHDQDQIKMEEYRKSLSELRSISNLKQQLDKGGDYEDKYIEEIKKNRSLEEQSQKFYEMLRIKKGMTVDIQKENSQFQRQNQELKSNCDYLKRELNQKEINYKNSLESCQKKIGILKSKLEQAKQLKGNGQQLSLLQDENSNLSNLSLKKDESEPFSAFHQMSSGAPLSFSERLQLSKQVHDSKEKRDKTLQNSKYEKLLPCTDMLEDLFQGEQGMLIKQHSNLSDSFTNTPDLVYPVKDISPSQLSIDKSKRGAQQALQNNKVPFFKKMPKLIEKDNSINSGGQGLFGISTSKNCLHSNKPSSFLENKSSGLEAQTKNSSNSIIDFFKQRKKK